MEILPPISITNESTNSAVVSFSGSKALLKKLTALAMVNILYNRVHINHRDFNALPLGNLTIQTIHRDAKHLFSKSILKWIKGFTDALDKSYLKELFFVICKRGQRDAILEHYKFRYSYMEDPAQHAGVAPQILADTMHYMFSTLGLLGNFEKWNDVEIELYMDLTYYKEVTPSDYRPIGFFDAEVETENEHMYNSYINLGKINTGYHSMSCRVKGNFKENSISGTPHSEKSMIPSIVSISDDENFVRCECEMDFKIPSIESVKCSKCGMLQHCPCAGMLTLENVVEGYLCYSCDDDRLKTQTVTQCLCRLTVAFCCKTKQIPAEIIQRYPTKYHRAIWSWVERVHLIIDGIHGKRVADAFFNSKKFHSMFNASLSQESTQESTQEDFSVAGCSQDLTDAESTMLKRSQESTQEDSMVLPSKRFKPMRN